MNNAWLHRFAILLAVAALLLIIDGAITGSGTAVHSSVMSVHRAAAIAVGLLTIALTVWLAVSDRRPEARLLGFLTLAIAALEVVAGLPSAQAMLPHAAPVLHACLAPLFFAAFVAIAVVTSAAWFKGPELVNDYGWPSNRSLAMVSPFLVLMQIALGAAFRQKAISLMPHVLGAMFVALVILMQCIFVLQQFKTHRALQAAGKTLLGVAFGQVFLGMTALIMRSMAEETAQPVVITVIAHITGGAITLATTLVLSILVRRNVQPRPQEEGEESEEPAVTG
jgi:heme A synthase